MQAFIGKSAKPPTPQELYRARRQKEEEEKGALLPPGFINHGNTCFMNSVLQGLMATPMLVDIVRFSLPETFSPILARRSPQLTNGHGLAGPSEREWEDGMPLGDTFVVLMYKAWKAQDERQRLTMSPKELLSKIGAKYDQYLDFRQQDAHELLRHLLDAMRMEEVDIIKERQPPSPKAKRKRKSKAASASNSPIPGPSSTPPEPTPLPEEDRLVSFVDMVFGGQLASILVCEKCKKVSFNYEDFDDLSLPIKQDDYEKARKRDKIRSLARKFGLRGRVIVRDLEVPEGPRSSSVPSSPLRRSEEAEKSFEIILNDRDSRRLSLEHGDTKPALSQKTIEEVIVDEETNQSDAGREDDKRYLSATGSLGSPKDKDEDSWVKLRRRLSAGVKKGSKRRRSKEIHKDNHPATIEESDAAPEADDAFVEVKAPTPIQVSPAVSPKIGVGLGLTRFPFPRRTSRAETASPATSTTPAQTPDISPSVLPPSTRPSSPSLPSVVSGQSASQSSANAKLPRPSKPSRSDAQYLKRLLADVPAQSGTTFNFFKNMPLANSSPDIADMRGSWAKAGQVQSIEGCLRMFTAVEMLEGENMVRCRRCWKIQHGQYVPKGTKAHEKEDEDDEAEDDDPPSSASSASVKINLVDDEDNLQRDDASTDNSPPLSAYDVSERQSLRSISTHTLSTSELLSGDKRDSRPGPGPLQKTYDTPSVPSISMTPPVSHATPVSESTLGVEPADVGVDGAVVRRTLHTSPSRDSLQLPSPPIRHTRMPAERSSLSLSLSSDASSVTSDESADNDTETSLAASVRSESSISSADPRQGASETSQSRDANARKERASTRAKQVVLRRAFKRYLISKPPPVLVVHLKRFQQTGRSPTQYYSIANLSKMDDPVSFSEYLDISPFLLPKKDAMKHGHGKGKNEEAVASEGGCIYRLYAVVVHIGNMLGGHYVAYVALPDRDEVSPNNSSIDDSSLSSDSASRSIHSQQSQNSSQQRPHVPRTASFARTANPPAAHKDKSRTSQSAPPGAQRQWCYVSDTTVRLVTLEEVLQSKAYICMYERLYL